MSTLFSFLLLYLRGKLRGKFTKLAFHILDDNTEQKTDNFKKIKQTKTLKG